MATTEIREGSGLANVGFPDVRMRERKEPTFVQFTEGEVVEGILLSIARCEVGDPPKAAVRYTVEDPESGEMYAFLGTYVINTKIRPTDRGHYVHVRFEGTDPTVQRNGNPMRRFKVMVSDKPLRASAVPQQGKALADGTFITDDDIPF